jgi:hypothetical protein
LESDAAAVHRPWLGELASLEWARADVFDAADEVALERGEVAALAPELLAELQLHATRHAIVTTTHAVDDVWRAVFDGRVPEAPRAEPVCLLVWRRDVFVCHRRIENAEYEAFRLAVRGARVGEVCDVLAEGRSDDEATPSPSRCGLGGSTRRCCGRRAEAS